MFDIHLKFKILRDLEVDEACEQLARELKSGEITVQQMMQLIRMLDEHDGIRATFTQTKHTQALSIDGGIRH